MSAGVVRGSVQLGAAIATMCRKNILLFVLLMILLAVEIVKSDLVTNDKSDDKNPLVTHTVRTLNSNDVDYDNGNLMEPMAESKWSPSQNPQVSSQMNETKNETSVTEQTTRPMPVTTTKVPSSNATSSDDQIDNDNKTTRPIRESTTPYFFDATTAATTKMTTSSGKATEEWQLQFKISTKYNANYADSSSSEHKELTETLFKPLNDSCQEVLKASFSKIFLPLTFKRGSVLVVSVIELLGPNDDVSNTSLWEQSLSSTLPDLFIPNTIAVSRFQPPSTPQNEATIIGIVCGTVAAILILITVSIVVVVRRKRKREEEEKKKREEAAAGNQRSRERMEGPGDGRAVGGVKGARQLPGSRPSMTWRQSSGTTSIGGSSKSNVYKEQSTYNNVQVDNNNDDDDDDDKLLHRTGIGKINFGNDFNDDDDGNNHPPSNQTEPRQHQRTSGGLPRLVVTSPQQQPQQPQQGADKGTVNTTTTTSTSSTTDKSVKVVVSSHAPKSASHMLHHHVPGSKAELVPADFGGLFVPEGPSDAGRPFSLGSKINRLNSSWCADGADIDLGSLAHAGDLYSLKPTQDGSSKVIAKAPSSLKKLFPTSKDNDIKLHRDAMDKLHSGLQPENSR